MAATAPHKCGSANHRQMPVNAASTCHAVPQPCDRTVELSDAQAQSQAKHHPCTAPHGGHGLCQAAQSGVGGSTALRSPSSNNQRAKPRLSPSDHQTRTRTAAVTTKRLNPGSAHQQTRYRLPTQPSNPQTAGCKILDLCEHKVRFLDQKSTMPNMSAAIIITE